MKDKKELRIVFLGTPDFAVTVLQALLQNEFNVVAVVTNVDKKSGRGMKTSSSAVKEFAVSENIPVLQPKNLKAPDFLEELASYEADLQVVVAFRMLPVVVWDMPPLGTINIHASLLPNYRGAAPINWAIINGEQKTGVTSFQLKHEIDTGDMLLQKEIPITPEDTAGSLHDKLATAGGVLICETLEKLCEGTLQPIPQQITKDNKEAPKIFKDDCKIDWNKSGEEIMNFVRGMNPYPAAFTYFDDKKVKIFTCGYSPNDKQVSNGTLISDNKNYVKIACADGWISLLEIQVQGKKRMLVQDFLRGNKV
jgi:methionyl-tRNA formyltransferase